jgi:putative ABC transport system permease protein
MNFIAIKMLLGDRAKYVGIIIGLTLASFLVTWPSTIFTGVMSRTFSFVTDIGLPDIWVVDPTVQYIEDVKPMRDTEVLRVRGTEGVQWAVGMYKGALQARLEDGTFQNCTIIGLDDSTLIGGPPKMITGQLSALRQAYAVIVDEAGARGKLARRAADGRRIPLKVGDNLELNDNRCVVVGICRVTQTFQNIPIIYMTYSRATLVAPSQRKMLSFVLAKAKPGAETRAVCARIGALGLKAYTPTEFKKLTFWYFLKYTGMPINFLTVVTLGFIVGVAISGQTFYNFTLDNLRYFGTLKAMGTTNRKLLRMISLQAAEVGAIGYGLGIGAASAWGGLLSGRTQIAFQFPWQLMLISAAAVLVICVGAAVLSIRKVMKLEPAIVFRS